MADNVNQHKRLAMGEKITPSSGSGGPRSDFRKGGHVKKPPHRPPAFTKKGSKSNC